MSTEKIFLGRNVPLFYFLPSSFFVQTAAWPVWVWVVGVLRLLLLAANAAAAAAITAVVVFCCCFEFPFFFWRSLPPFSFSSNVCGLHPHLIIEFTTTFLIESTIFLLLLLFISFFKGGPFLSFFCPVHATNVHICGQSNCQPASTQSVCASCFYPNRKENRGRFFFIVDNIFRFIEGEREWEGLSLITV